MKAHDKEYYLSILFSKFFDFSIDDIDYRYFFPTHKIRLKTNLFIQHILDEYKFEDWITDEESKRILIQRKIILPNIDESLKQIETSLEDAKIELYLNFIKEKNKEKIQKKIVAIKEKQQELYSNYHLLENFSLNGYANLAATHFIVSHCVKRKDKIKIDFTTKLLNLFTNKINDNTLSESALRELARTEPWYSYWASSRGNIFGIKPADMTIDQRRLIIFTKMYEGARKSVECPDDDIFNDDDAFDGWMLHSKRNADKDRANKYVEKMVGQTQSKYNELYLAADSKEEADKIQQFNSLDSMMKIKQREAVIKQKGVAEDKDFLEHKMEITNQQIEAIKGRR